MANTNTPRPCANLYASILWNGATEPVVLPLLKWEDGRVMVFLDSEGDEIAFEARGESHVELNGEAVILDWIHGE